MVLRFPGRLAELLNDVGRRGEIGVPHAEVNDVLALGPRLDLEVGDDREDVGGQALDAMKLFHGASRFLKRK